MASKEHYQYFIREIDERIRSIPDIIRIFDAYVTSIAECLHAERAFIMYSDPLSGEMRVCGTFNIQPELVNTTADVSQTVLSNVMEEKKPIVSFDAMQDPRFQDRTSVVISGLRSILCVPIILENRYRGLIYLDNKAQNAAFKNPHIEVLSEFLDATQDALSLLFRRFDKEFSAAPPPREIRPIERPKRSSI